MYSTLRFVCVSPTRSYADVWIGTVPLRVSRSVSRNRSSAGRASLPESTTCSIFPETPLPEAATTLPSSARTSSRSFPRTVSPTFAVADEIASSKATRRIVPCGISFAARGGSAGALSRVELADAEEVFRDWVAVRRFTAFLCETTIGSAVIRLVSAGWSPGSGV
jgi:hypothetical protein